MVFKVNVKYEMIEKSVYIMSTVPHDIITLVPKEGKATYKNKREGNTLGQPE